MTSLFCGSFDDCGQALAEMQCAARVAAFGASAQLAERKAQVSWLLRTGGEFERKLLRDVKRIIRRSASSDTDEVSDNGTKELPGSNASSTWPSMMQLATELSMLGYTVVVRRSLGSHSSGGDPACFKNLRHEFLLVQGQGDCEGADCIVETRLRDHFSITHPSPAYSQLLACLPDAFVACTTRFLPVIQVLCAEMAESFASQGQAAPPWRRLPALMSKWFPHHAQDTPVTMTFAAVCEEGACAPAACSEISMRHTSPLRTTGFHEQSHAYLCQQPFGSPPGPRYAFLQPDSDADVFLYHKAEVPSRPRSLLSMSLGSPSARSSLDRGGDSHSINVISGNSNVANGSSNVTGGSRRSSSGFAEFEDVISSKHNGFGNRDF